MVQGLKTQSWLQCGSSLWPIKMNWRKRPKSCCCHPSRLAPAHFRRCCASAYVSLSPASNFGVTGRRDQSAFAFDLRLHRISTRQSHTPPKAPEGWRTPGRFAKYDRRRNSRSVWTAVTSAPLFVRTRNIHHSSLSARPTAPLKPAHSKTLRGFQHNGVGQCFQPVSIQKKLETGATPVLRPYAR
jgi:hypothetical protein